MSVALTPDGGNNSFNQPSGIPEIPTGSQTNSPIAASLGGSNANDFFASSILSGTDMNTPPGKKIWEWDKYAFTYNAYYELGGFHDGTVLQRSLIEKDDQYKDRRGTSYYRNFFRSIIDATWTPVFASDASRKTEIKGQTSEYKRKEYTLNKSKKKTKKPVLDEAGDLTPFINKFLDDVDNCGTYIQDFMKDAARYANLLGISYIIVDNFPMTDVLLQTEALDNRILPFVYLRYPQQVERALLKTDRFGKIEEIVFKENPESVIDEHGKKKIEPRWKKWTKDYSVMLKANKEFNNPSIPKEDQFDELPDTKTVYNLSRVPIVTVISDGVEKNTVLPHPKYYNIAKCNWALFNADSELRRMARAQMFAMLVKPQTSDNNARTKQAVGPTQAIELPPDRDGQSYVKPYYVSPDVGPYNAMVQTIQDLKEDLYRLAGQEGIRGIAATAAKSGLAKSYDWYAQEQVLKATAKMTKAAEEDMIDVVKLYVNEEAEYEVLYEDNYHPQSSDEDVQLYTDYLAIDPGPEGSALAKEQATRSVFSDLDDEQVQPVIEAIRQKVVDDKKVEEELPPEDPTLTPEEQQQQDLKDTIDQALKPINNYPQKAIKKMPKNNKFSIRNQQ